MNKKILASLLLTVVILIGAVPMQVLAEDSEVKWTVMFDSNARMRSNYKSEVVNEAVAGMQPGDSVTFTVSTLSQYAKPTDWYLRNDAIKSLEESTAAAKAAGGAYSYVLKYKDNTTNKEVVLYDSDTVGGDAHKEGLKSATTSLNDWQYLGSLTKDGKGGTITLKMTLEGETQGNRYQDTVADVILQLGVEIQTQKKTTERKVITTRGRANRPKTGDTNRMILYAAVAAAAGIILLVYAILAIKRRKEETAAAGAEEGGKGGIS